MIRAILLLCSRDRNSLRSDRSHPGLLRAGLQHPRPALSSSPTITTTNPSSIDDHISLLLRHYPTPQDCPDALDRSDHATDSSVDRGLQQLKYCVHVESRPFLSRIAALAEEKSHRMRGEAKLFHDRTAALALPFVAVLVVRSGTASMLQPGGHMYRALSSSISSDVCPSETSACFADGGCTSCWDAYGSAMEGCFESMTDTTCDDFQTLLCCGAGDCWDNGLFANLHGASGHSNLIPPVEIARDETMVWSGRGEWASRCVCELARSPHE